MKKKWEIAHADAGTEQALLNQGWEPFGVAIEDHSFEKYDSATGARHWTPHSTTVIWFRRQVKQERDVKDGEPQYLSTTEAAIHLGIHASTLRRWTNAGTIPVTVLGRWLRRYELKDLDNYLSQRREH